VTRSFQAGYAATLLIVAVVGHDFVRAVPAAQRSAPAPASADLVELDVVVLDRVEQPVSNLRQEDFTIKEDGHVVDVKTFAHVSALGSLQPDDARSVTLLMDDIGVSMTGTSAMQAIAQVMLSPSERGDEIAVVRLSSRSDEAFGDVSTALDRIGGYRGGMVPFSRRDTPETVLKMVTKISRQLEAVEHRRKVIICVGLPVVCDPEEPVLVGTSALWPHWVAALTAAARANVSVYCLDPTGLNQRATSRGVGLVRLTGGELFTNSNDFVSAAYSMWRDAGRYYLLGYWPSPGKRELHSVEVSVARKDLHLRVRRRRGE
jgi:VWFA-related protein